MHAPIFLTETDKVYAIKDIHRTISTDTLNLDIGPNLCVRNVINTMTNRRTSKRCNEVKFYDCPAIERGRTSAIQ